MGAGLMRLEHSVNQQLKEDRVEIKQSVSEIQTLAGNIMETVDKENLSYSEQENKPLSQDSKFNNSMTFLQLCGTVHAANHLPAIKNVK
ncbi:hypothetical protein SS50377_23919 [Spironucleus salmonicida]|uniref:Uncharacterized protein n=1 Tax=Spironucleus salmonicida TaxID=348837 RepID=A0A9P8LTJ4_9EUKA|nr:hypothetical protein SS50377_23919 [Spironucleus salmonicida]